MGARCLYAVVLLLPFLPICGVASELPIPRSWGTAERGGVVMPLYRGAAVPFEILLPELPCGCENFLLLRMRWDAEADAVTVQLEGENALEPFPDVDRTLGVNYFPNKFFPEPEDVVDGRYQLWIVGGAGPVRTFYYKPPSEGDPESLNLLGSELDFAEPPPAIPVEFPTLYLFGSPMFQPDANGDVDMEWTFPYSGAVRGDRPDLAHIVVTFPPPNLALANPFRLDQSTLRPYVAGPAPALQARPWSDYLRGGLLFDVTIETAEYFLEPPTTTLAATYSGATAVAGGIPKGWTFDIEAAFMNVAPPIKPFAGRDSCAPFYEFHGTPPDVDEEMIEIAAAFSSSSEPQSLGRTWHCPPVRIRGNGARQMHQENTVRFHSLQPGSDASSGQALFGLAADGVSEDPSGALFEGESAPYGGVVVSNGRTCFTCHRGPDEGFGLSALPLRDSIAADDSLFTGIEADTGGDPDGLHNLDELGLVKIRPNRFDPRRDPGDPYLEVFGWRKSPKLWNIGLQQGFLTDLRGRTMFETARGAVFSHTQGTDRRFDDLFPLGTGSDLEAFMFGIFSSPELVWLREPDSPMFSELVADPYLTVPMETPAQRRGRQIFHRNCFACHNTPQVFSNLANVEPLGNGDRPPDFPSWAPAVGRSFNIGVSKRNRHGLRFTHYPSGDLIVIPLADEDGEINVHEVQFDIGLAATTGRTEDIGRFKVPQLRNLGINAPYFHDNSAATIEEVVDYKTSPAYSRSKDGRRFPIDLTRRQKRDLIAFLKVL